MYIPDSGIAAKALAGLDQPRRDFAIHFADRISLLPAEALHDDKRIRTELLLELQSRLTPEEAARISYTSSDILVSIALSVVRGRHQAVETAKLGSQIIIGLLISVVIIAVYMFFSHESPKSAAAEVKAESRVAPASK